MSYKLTKADNGKTVSVAVGDSFEIELSSNPTTGFRWALVSEEKNIYPSDEAQAIENKYFHIKHEYIGPNTGLLGAGGMDRFRVTPRVSGEREVEFVYARSWEAPDPAAKRFRVVVHTP